MYSAAFIFQPGDYDEAFYQLDGIIQEVAQSMDGFIGKDGWQSADGKTINVTYFWQNEASILAFASHPKHLEAKAQYAQWYEGYQVIISKVIRTYGDKQLKGLTVKLKG